MAKSKHQAYLVEFCGSNAKMSLPFEIGRREYERQFYFLQRQTVLALRSGVISTHGGLRTEHKDCWKNIDTFTVGDATTILTKITYKEQEGDHA